MKFKDLLIELTVSQAQAALGVSSDYDQKELKRAYRKAAMRNHPDKGGTKKEMQKVIDAYHLLKNTNPQSRDSRRAAEERTERAEAVATWVRDMVIENVALNKYTDHFEAIFEDSFTAEAETTGDRYSRSYKVRFTADNKNIWFELHFYINISNYYDVKLGNDVNVSVYGSGFFNKRKYKLYNSDYSGEQRKLVSALEDPSVIFPESKLKKHIKSKRKLSKRDFLQQLKGLNTAQNWNKDTWMIDTKDPDIKARAFRNVIMRTAAWSIDFVRMESKYKAKPIRELPRKTVPEVEELLNLFPEMDRMTPEQIGKELEDISF